MVPMKTILTPPGGGRGASSRQSSFAINKQREERRVHQENLKLVERLEKARGTPGAEGARASANGKANLTGGSSAGGARATTRKSGIPPGWTRGIGGQLMPPPKLRWGNQKYDAGDWNS